ncbi:MAG: ABC transporter ATP-binding protein [Thermodesulfobacteriota bacterium]
MLTVKNIHTYYDDSHVIDDVSLRVAQGELVAILGRNGVGKSTMLKSIMGLVTPRNGSILFKGEEIRGRSPSFIARKGIGYVPEERRIFPHLTVRENLIMGIKTGTHRKTEGKWTIERVYGNFPLLAERDGTPGGKLSGGEQQMLTMMRTLMGEPELVLLDEPSEGLSPTMASTIFSIIVDIHKDGLSIILVDRNLTYTCTMAQRVYIMSKGRIGFEGTGEEVLGSREIQAKFLAV